MNKKILLGLLILIISTALFAQTEPDPTQTGVTTGQQELKEISISKFEHPGFWYPVFPHDDGICYLRGFPGNPLDKEPIQDEIDTGIIEVDQDGVILSGDNYVIGAKVYFYRRGVINFAIRPVRPIPVPGITKTISVWVAGRNTNHRLEAVVADHYGNEVLLNMGKLNFLGWKKLTVSVPPAVKQRDYHYQDRLGLTFEGFNISCDIDETYGTYYIYFDDLRVVTDLFSESSRDQDDMLDSW
ncbi:MAG: flagellar filament protein FlaA [Spirochaetaceae bacterium]|jgi:hypothetical protein|nr:flagellar filament protein FlaA [Spirochaetaceae bacterium]